MTLDKKALLNEIARIADKYDVLGNRLRILILVVLLARGKLIQSELVTKIGSIENLEYEIAPGKESEIPEEIRKVAKLVRG
jgi:hypothetical protein